MNQEKQFVEVDDDPWHKEEFSNQFVRIHRAVLEPGTVTLFHRHTKDTINVAIKGGKMSSKKMKGSGQVPSVLPGEFPLSEKLTILFKKIFRQNATIKDGTYFLMNSYHNPTIHKAFASKENTLNMDFVGVEILHSQCKKVYSKSEGIENDQIHVLKKTLLPNEIIEKQEIEHKCLILVIKGELTVEQDSSQQILKSGKYLWHDGKGNITVKNSYDNKTEFLFIFLKY